MRGPVRVKREQRSWFAAGAGMERALGELSDAAFKVFVHVCLRAERASGCLEFRRRELARAVGKSRSTLGRCLRELAGKGVCELEAAANQHGVSRLRVRPRYWPYEVREEPARKQEPAEREGPRTAGEASAYVAEVRRLFRQPACVQGRFGTADERLAADWQRAGVALETVRRAILLGSVRKSMSLLDRPAANRCEACATSQACWRRCARSRSRLPTGGMSSSASADARGCGGTGLSKGPKVPVRIWHRQTRREGPGSPRPQHR